MDNETLKKWSVNNNILSLKYDREKIKPGILHIGLGNFHRAHQEYYINSLLEDPNQKNWGVCGVSLLPGDENLYKALKSQDNLYSLTIFGRDGIDKTCMIGSIVESLWAMEDSEKIIQKIADPNIKIITLTITEGGYNINKSSGDFMLNTPSIQSDLNTNNKPTTVFGYIAAGLRKRKNTINKPITILSCDNLQHNGNTAKKAFLSFIKAQDEELSTWVENNITFPNAMVDRITPAVSEEDKERLNKKNNINDLAPVYCEDFIQWVVEDNFIAGRPDWGKVGVQMTEDVSVFENMKLSLLNASHTLLSYPSFLMGYRKVDEAMKDNLIIQYVKDFMNLDITPYVKEPEGINLTEYKQVLIERFANSSVSDQISRLCADGVSKIPVYIMPNLNKMLNENKDMTRLAFFVASYRHYLKYKKDDTGHSFPINEPWLDDEDEKNINSNNSLDFLLLSPFSSNKLLENNKFCNEYTKMNDLVYEKGIKEVLKFIITSK
ncbi:mannitol dehydrogenase family protein [Apibacter raozihei]|uniref:mannitol dehydrogenase family protein n=1 Tax=Apibacter raozihei TaxID=2500547 RepID=UPI000FE3AFB4|nr:mannitol dehydrogenase family protein [Apibacter raozihei]